MVTSALETAADPGQVEVVAYSDDDMPLPLAAIREMGLVPDRAVIRSITGPRIVLSECWNRCYEQAQGEIVMQCADDLRFASLSWDKRVAETFAAYPDHIVLVHGDDGHQHGALGTHSWLHRRWVEIVGYFVPRVFSCDWNDVWLCEVADAIGRRVYLPDVYTPHLHPDAGRGAWDQTHAERAARGARDNVASIYARLAPERERDAAKLRAVMDDGPGGSG